MGENDDIPPPAYSEQEFDQKISIALDASLTTPTQTAEEEAWEEWNEAAFEAASRAVSGESGSSGPTHVWSNQSAGGSASQRAETYPPEKGGLGVILPTPASIEPLRIHKRSASNGKSGLSKTYFDGYGENHNGSSSSSSKTKTNPDSYSQVGIGGPAPRSIPHATQTTYHNVPLDDEADDFSVPPPPFAPVEPNPDGTPIVIMSYDPSTSAPPSPLSSPMAPHLQLPDHRHPFPQVLPQRPYLQQPDGPPEGLVPRPSRQSLPAPPRPSNQHLGQPLGKRPSTMLGPTPMQRMGFNPPVIHNKRGGLPLLLPVQQHTQPYAQSFNANAFYKLGSSIMFCLSCLIYMIVSAPRSLLIYQLQEPHQL
jgi:hypothetical protein